jgi:hypothetical protein
MGYNMNPYWPVIIPGALVIYCVAMRRLQKAVQPFRIEMVEKGEWLLSSNLLSNEAKKHVHFLLDTAFGSRLVLLVGLFGIPIISIFILIHPKFLLDIEKSKYIRDPQAKICFDRVSDLHDRITLANHPILFPIFSTERSIVMQILALLFALFRGTPQPIGGDDVMVFVEKKMPRRRMA